MKRAESIAVKVKAFPVKAWTCLECSRRFRLPVFTTEDEGGKLVSPKHRPPLPVRKYPWHSFLLEGEPTPGL